MHGNDCQQSKRNETKTIFQELIIDLRAAVGIDLAALVCNA